MTYFTYLNIQYSVNIDISKWVNSNLPVKLPDNTYVIPITWDETQNPITPICRECKAPELYSSILEATLK